MKSTLPYELKITRAEIVARDVMELELSTTDGTPLAPWSPGAHIDVDLGEGVLRQYSLTGCATDMRHYRIAILREASGRGGSVKAHQLQAGDSLGTSLPRNHFELQAAASYLFIAGGIGITPIAAMIEQAEAAGAAWTLAYGGRNRASMAYAAQLQQRFGDKVTLYPQDECGHLPLADLFAARGVGALVYCCGPDPLLRAIEACAADWQDPQSLHLERFAAKEIAPPVAGERGFEIYCARSDMTLHVPADRTILEVLEEAGIEVMVSCCSGTCGTCETAVLDGIPDHRDSVLTQSEQAAGKSILVCVSRALSDRLTLDL